MKNIKNIHSPTQLLGIIIVACVFTFSLLFIKNYFQNKNNSTTSVLGTTCIFPYSYGCGASYPCCTGTCSSNGQCLMIIPTKAPSPTKCIYPYSYGCGSGYPCCIGNCVNGRCVMPVIPTPVRTSIPVTSTVNQWKTYIWSDRNISLKYPPEWGESENKLSPIWYSYNKHFGIDTFGGYNFDNPVNFLKLRDSLPSNFKMTHTNDHTVRVGSYRGVMRDEFFTNNESSFERLAVYFIDNKHMAYGVYWIAFQPAKVTQKDRQIFESMIASFKAPLDPNSDKPINTHYVKGCTSVYDTGCIKSGKCCWGTCKKNDRCEPY